MQRNSFVNAVESHFDDVSVEYDRWKDKNKYYYDTIKKFISSVVPPNSSVLEIGCATGDVLASVKPTRGLGIDLSGNMIARARQKYPAYEFQSAPVESFSTQEKFDAIIMVDVLDHVFDVLTLFRKLRDFCHPKTIIVATTANPLWTPILWLSEKVGAKMPEGPHRFISQKRLKNTLVQTGFKLDCSGYLLFMPKKIPWISDILNEYLVRAWAIRRLSLVHYVVLSKSTT